MIDQEILRELALCEDKLVSLLSLLPSERSKSALIMVQMMLSRVRDLNCGDLFDVHTYVNLN